MGDKFTAPPLVHLSMSSEGTVYGVQIGGEPIPMREGSDLHTVTYEPSEQNDRIHADTMGALPRVSIYDSKEERYVAIFYGPGSEDRASALMENLPGDPDRYDYSVSDDQCADCKTMFSSEAREYEQKHGWVCPACGGDPVKP